MKRRPYFLSGTALAALVATAFTLETDPVRAQQAEEEQGGRAIEEIVVTAKPIAYRKVERTEATGGITETLTLERHISYADLDLSKHSDVTRLKNRIEISAKEACDELDKIYPIPRWGPSDRRACIKRAIESANNDLEAALSAAD
jgi:UrcA family protein